MIAFHVEAALFVGLVIFGVIVTLVDLLGGRQP